MLGEGVCQLRNLSKYKVYGIVIIWGVALLLFEKCCFAVAGALLDRSMGTIHFFMAEKLVP